ncbi:MAG: FtsX-like permease family protein [Acidimicrobiia bacterium]|nr:FtsX-like permease family protein [Acidimicrobiia bacterium]
MMLLRLISWPYFRKHIVRSLLTIAGIVLGVAVFVGMHTANQGVLFAFNSTVDRIAGKTELQVTAGETGFDEAVLESVQSASTVRVAVPVIEATVDSQIAGQGNLLVLGTDMTGDRSLRDYDLEDADEAIIDDPLVFLAQPDSIMLAKEFAEKNDLAVNDTVTLGTVLGPRAFTVRGIMRSSGLTSAFGGNLAIMDIYAAQHMFGRGRTFDRIDLATRDGASIEKAQEELRQLLGPGFQIDAPAGRGRQFEAMTASYSIMINISSLFALFIGMFIIYNSFAIAVTQRRSEIGILRALGATGGQVRGLFLLESAVTGLIGSLGGVLLGLVMARGIAASIGGVMKDVYGVAQRADEVATDPALLALSLIIGIGTSLVAAFIPARQAARVDPVQALQKGKYQVLSVGESRLRALAAAAFVITSILCLTAASSRVAFYVGYALAILAALLLGPLLAQWLGRALRPVLKWMRPVEGALAADSLIQTPRRTSASVAALMLSLALVTAFAGMARASYDSILDWTTTTLNPDLFVSPSPEIVSRTLRFPGPMGETLAALPGIARVQKVRNARILFNGAPVMIVAVEIGSVAEMAPSPPIEGDATEMYRLAAAGEGVMISDNLAKLHGLHAGQVLTIPAPHGLISLPIVGVVLDYSDQQGSILVDRTVYERYWRDDSINLFRVYLTPDASPADAKAAILQRFASERQVFVFTNRELRDYILRITDQWFGLTTVQIAVAVFVAILGIVNTLTVSIIDRRRELGVLKAVGGLRGQIRRTIWMEAVSIGTLGLILGFALGALNLYYILQIVEHDIAGMRLEYVFPVTTMVALVPTILAAAFVASLWPAESAVRGSLVEALEYE